MFAHIFHSSSKSWIIYHLKKEIFQNHFFFFFFLRLVFKSIHDFSQAFWLNLIILWTFLKITPLFNASSKFCIWITYSVLSSKLARNFSIFSTLFFMVRIVNHYEVYVIFQYIEHQLQEKSFVIFFIIAFYEIFIKLRGTFYPLKIIY